jgi:hypothetical protein
MQPDVRPFRNKRDRLVGKILQRTPSQHRLWESRFNFCRTQESLHRALKPVCRPWNAQTTRKTEGGSADEIRRKRGRIPCGETLPVADIEFPNAIRIATGISRADTRKVVCAAARGLC